MRSPPTIRPSVTSQGRTIVHSSARENTQKHGGEYELKSEMVVNLPAGRLDWRRHLPGVVAETIL